MVKIKDLRPITPRTNGTRSLSAIKNIARHHSATTTGNWDAFWRHWNGTLKWGTGGYHEIILRDGTVELCYDPHEITNGVGGQNSYIYNICLVGNGSFTAEQERVFDERARYWMQRLGLPASAVKGHNEFPKQATSCPGINMNTVRAQLSKPSTSSPVEDEPKKEVDEMTKYMDEKLPLTQQADAAKLFEQAYKDKVFETNHAPEVKSMTRRRFYDLKLSLEIREKLNK